MTTARLTLLLAQARAMREERDRLSQQGKPSPELGLLTDLGHEVAALLARVQQGSTWLPMTSAPRDGREILVLCTRSNTRGCLIVHWAQGGGEDQPRYGPAWFYHTPSCWHDIDEKQLHGWLPPPEVPHG